MCERADNLGAADSLSSDLSFELDAGDAAAGLPSWSKLLLALLLLEFLVPVCRALYSPPVG